MTNATRRPERAGCATDRRERWNNPANSLFDRCAARALPTKISLPRQAPTPSDRSGPADPGPVDAIVDLLRSSASPAPAEALAGEDSAAAVARNDKTMDRA